MTGHTVGQGHPWNAAQPDSRRSPTGAATWTTLEDLVRNEASRAGGDKPCVGPRVRGLAGGEVVTTEDELETIRARSDGLLPKTTLPGNPRGSQNQTVWSRRGASTGPMGRGAAGPASPPRCPGPPEVGDRRSRSDVPRSRCWTRILLCDNPGRPDVCSRCRGPSSLSVVASHGTTVKSSKKGHVNHLDWQVRDKMLLLFS